MLPENTVQWFCFFTTRKTDATQKNLNLSLPIARIITSVYTSRASSTAICGISKAAPENIFTPGGTSSVNSYVLNPEEKNKFINGDKFNHLHYWLYDKYNLW